jgi:iron complex outermembrane recepter protein
MSRNCKLRRAIKLALLSGASTVGVSAMSSAYAQDANESEQLEEITVTGSRILRQDYEATSPVFTLNADAFRDAGTPQLEQVLNALPQLVPSLTTTSNNPGSGGQAWLDLRGLGTQRTLVLLDGSRLQPSTTGGVVDLNTIPAAMIESVEILTGGSSATYGSDAIAGVVNVKLRQDFEGVYLGGLTTQSAEGDGATHGISLLLGGNLDNDRGNVVLAFNYDRREALFASERDFSAVAYGPDLQPLGSTSRPEGSFVPSGANSPSQAAYDAVFGGTVPNTSSISFNPDGSVFSTSPVVGYTGDTSDPAYNPANYTYNFAPVNYLQLPLERRQIAGFGHYAITDNIEAHARMIYTNYQSDVELAATPVSSGVGSTMPATNQFIPADLATILASRPDPTADFTFTKRTLDVGPRTGKNGWDVVQGQVGLRGEFQMLNNDWRWDAFANWGKTRRTELQGGNVSRSRLQAAYNGDDTNSALAGTGCIGANGLNPFGLGTMSEACARAVGINATNVTELETQGAVASLAGGLFELPAGTLQTAFGLEYRKGTGVFRPDEFLSSGDVVGFNAAQPVNGTIDVSEAFVEFSVPLLADAPMANYLGLDAAYRYSDYNTAGAIDTYMVGLDYQPTETLKLRGSFNRATRAPSIGELFTPASEGFPQYSDPCWNGSDERTGPDAAQVNALCATQGAFANFPQGNAQVRAITGGNVDLEPETADTYTFGVVWQPTFGDNDLRMAVDWFRYEITDTIDSVGASSIISRCFNSQDANPTYDPANVWCTLFERTPSGEATGVRADNQNLGQRNVDGVDLQVDYALPLGPGDLQASLALTHLLKWELQEDPAAPLAPVEGTITVNLAEAFPENKARLALGYAFENYNVRWTMNYIDGMQVVNNDAERSDVTVGLAPSVPTYVYHRLTGSWAVTDDLSFTLGIDNLTDKQPPIYTADNGAGVQSNTDPSVYDVLGRRYFLSANWEFGND